MPGTETATRLTITDLQLLTEISSMLTSLDRDHVLDRVIALATRAVGAQRSSLLLHPDHRRDWAPLLVKYPPHGDEAQGEDTARQILEHGLVGWVMRERHGTIVADTTSDPRWIASADGRAQSALCVPFMSGDAVLGALTMLHDAADHFTDHDLQLLTIVVNQATVAIQNAQLFHQLHQQKRQLEAILGSMPDLLVVLSREGQIVIVNNAARALLNPDHTVDDVVGHWFDSLVRGDPVLQEIQTIISNPNEARLWSFEARSSLHRDYLATIAVWEAEPNGMGGYVVVMRDITQLRDLNRFKDEMLQMASHDLRSPLALIVGYCDLIAMDTPEGSSVHEYLDIIQRSTERMRGLLDDLLKVEQIRTSPLELNEQVNFAELVGTVLTNMKPTVDKKQLALTTDVRLEGLPPAIVLNPMLIRESMENLISNAVKYTAAQGTITVRTFVHEGNVHFVVEDSGIGIPKSALPRLFQSFYRVKQKGAEKVDGRGLGLSLVKTVVERHQGQVWVESEPGVGSKFGFWFPIVVR